MIAREGPFRKYADRDTWTPESGVFLAPGGGGLAEREPHGGEIVRQRVRVCVRAPVEEVEHRLARAPDHHRADDFEDRRVARDAEDGAALRVGHGGQAAQRVDAPARGGLAARRLAVEDA